MYTCLELCHTLFGFSLFSFFFFFGFFFTHSKFVLDFVPKVACSSQVPIRKVHVHILKANLRVHYIPHIRTNFGLGPMSTSGIPRTYARRQRRQVGR